MYCKYLNEYNGEQHTQSHTHAHTTHILTYKCVTIGKLLCIHCHLSNAHFSCAERIREFVVCHCTGGRGCAVSWCFNKCGICLLLKFRWHTLHPVFAAAIWLKLRSFVLLLASLLKTTQNALLMLLAEVSINISIIAHTVLTRHSSDLQLTSQSGEVTNSTNSTKVIFVFFLVILQMYFHMKIFWRSTK